MSILKVSPALLDPFARPPAGVTRRLAASALTGASGLLARLADSILERTPAPTDFWPRLEFHADAGAGFGALYLDGELIGHLPGVGRL